MAAITLHQRDAAELADLLDFLLDQIYRLADPCPQRIQPLLDAGTPYGIEELRHDVNRMIHILTSPQKNP